MKVGKELMAASASPLVLAILRRGPSYGYALIRDVRELSGGELTWSEGMLYPVLHRLETQGLITSYEERGENGRLRRYYRLSKEGRRAIERERQQWEVVHGALARAWAK
jgi:PadR family transcriptional regulator PadR